MSLPARNRIEALNLKTLRYSGQNPDNPNVALFVGPHGLPFSLKLDAVKNVLSLKTPRLGASLSSAGVQLDIAHSPIACMNLKANHITDLPLEPAERAGYLLGLVVELIETKEPACVRGTLAEMLALLQHYASLKGTEFHVFSALNKRGTAILRRHADSATIHDGLPATIARWFKPIASRPWLAKRPWIDERLRVKLAAIKPQSMTAHDRLEALSTLSQWLIARRTDKTLPAATIAASMHEIGVSEP